MENLTKTLNGVEVPLTEEELSDFNRRELEHGERLAAESLVKYREQREAEYPSVKDLVVALIEKEEGRPEALNAIMLKRLQIKNKYPKP